MMPPSRVKVIVRLLPSSTATDDDDDEGVLKVQLDPDSPSSAPLLCLRSKDSSSWQGFKFDAVCDERATQTDVFTHISDDVLGGLLKGVSSTIFAYGQTGTGKSYTMLGRGFENAFGNASSWDQARQEIFAQKDQWGVIPRSVYQLFTRLDNTMNDSSFKVTASFMQIYNDRVHDLLASGKSNKLGLPIREDANALGGVDIDGLISYEVDCPEAAIRLLYRGGRRRIVRETTCNERSSRSHAIFRLAIEVTSSSVESEGAKRRAILNLVDLAGSERWGSDERSQFSARELTKINTSLSALGNCVSALVKRHKHIPFRDSSLTRILKDCLGGGARAVIISTVSGRPSARFETASTLVFASRALELSKVLPNVKVDEKVDDAVLLRRAKAEIRRLKEAMEESSSRSNDDEKDSPNEWETKVKVATETINDLVGAIEDGKISPDDVGTELDSFFTLSRRLQESVGVGAEDASRASATMQVGEDTCERTESSDQAVSATASPTSTRRPTTTASDSTTNSSRPVIKPLTSPPPPSSGEDIIDDGPLEPMHQKTSSKADVASPSTLPLSPLSLAEAKHEELCSSFDDVSISDSASPVVLESSPVVLKSKAEPRTCKRHDLEDCFICREQLDASAASQTPGAHAQIAVSSPKNPLKPSRARRKPLSEPRPRWTHRTDESRSTGRSQNRVGRQEQQRRQSRPNSSAKGAKVGHSSSLSRSGNRAATSTATKRMPTTFHHTKQNGIPSHTIKPSNGGNRHQTKQSAIAIPSHKIKHSTGGSCIPNPRRNHENVQSAKDRARMAIAEASRVLANM